MKPMERKAPYCYRVQGKNQKKSKEGKEDQTREEENQRKEEEKEEGKDQKKEESESEREHTHALFPNGLKEHVLVIFGKGGKGGRIIEARALSNWDGCSMLPAFPASHRRAYATLAIFIVRLAMYSPCQSATIAVAAKSDFYSSEEYFPARQASKMGTVSNWLAI